MMLLVEFWDHRNSFLFTEEFGDRYTMSISNKIQVYFIKETTEDKTK